MSHFLKIFILFCKLKIFFVLGATTLCITMINMTLSIISFSTFTFSITIKTHHSAYRHWRQQTTLSTTTKQPTNVTLIKMTLNAQCHFCWKLLFKVMSRLIVLNAVLLNVIYLNVVTLIVRTLDVVMLNVLLINVLILNVILKSVVMLSSCWVSSL